MEILATTPLILRTVAVVLRWGRHLIDRALPPKRFDSFVKHMHKIKKDFVKGFACVLMPWLKKYYRFLKSQTNRVTVWQFLTFWLSASKRGKAYWPVHKTSEIVRPDYIHVGINSNAGTRPGCYLQGNGGIWIGNYVHIASNIGIISSNHDLYNQRKFVCKEVRIGDYTRIGQGAIILPGVILGPRTIVGANSVVTKSFPAGFCVIGGNPAKLIKDLDKEQFVPTRYEEEYYGFIPKDKFHGYAKRYLKTHRYYNEILKQSK